MQSGIKFPAKCTDQELAEILAKDPNFFIDFPYSKVEGRTLTYVDYQEEQLRRRQEVEEAVTEQADEFLISFMDQLALQAPQLHSELKLAIVECDKTMDPVKLAISPDDLASRSHIAHVAVRTVIRQLFRLTLVASSSTDFWLLPSNMDATKWFEKKRHFSAAEHVGKRFPYASVALELLAKDAKQKPEHFSVTEFDDTRQLQEVINVLVAYGYYYRLEELHRVMFAFGYGNKVIAQTIAGQTEHFQHFISPANQLEAWKSYV